MWAASQVERTLNLQAAFMRLVDPVMVKNYCWVLKEYANNSPLVNECVVHFLRKVMEGGMQAMLFQLSILRNFQVRRRPSGRGREIDCDHTGDGRGFDDSVLRRLPATNPLRHPTNPLPFTNKSDLRHSLGARILTRRRMRPAC